MVTIEFNADTKMVTFPECEITLEKLEFIIQSFESVEKDRHNELFYLRFFRENNHEKVVRNTSEEVAAI